MATSGGSLSTRGRGSGRAATEQTPPPPLTPRAAPPAARAVRGRGAPGDAATVTYFIARTSVKKSGPGSLVIGLYKLRWTPPANATAAPTLGLGNAA